MDPGELPPARAVRFAEAVQNPIGGSETEDAAGSMGAGDFKTHHLNTPKLGQQVQYKKPSDRAPALIAQHGSMHKPNYEDMLRRVGIVVQQHVSKCEHRLKSARAVNKEHVEEGLFHTSQVRVCSPLYPMCRIAMCVL
jgi:type IV secretory pathway protease TraF